MATNAVETPRRFKSETGRGQSLVGDWMRLMPQTIAPNRSIASARALLLEYGISDLPVMSKCSLVGIVTDQDLQGDRALKPGHRNLRNRIETSPDEVPISAVMKTQVVTLSALGSPRAGGGNDAPRTCDSFAGS